MSWSRDSDTDPGARHLLDEGRRRSFNNQGDNFPSNAPTAGIPSFRLLRPGRTDSYTMIQDPEIRARFEEFERFERYRQNERRLRPSFSRYSSKSSHPNEHLVWHERLKHTTWAYFTLTMATGGIANVIHDIPFHSEFLRVVGYIFFAVNLVLYAGVWIMILTRFITHPKTFRNSLIHPTESLFVPAALVSFGIICVNIVEYTHSMSDSVLHLLTGLFWFYVVMAFTLSIAIYMILWSSLTFTIAQMTPIWIFPAYPLLLVGPHAANLSGRLPSSTTSLEVIVCGFTVQGIGFLVSLTIYAAFVYRLMTQKLPADPSRPAMFVSVGPAAFTCSGTIGMAANLDRAIANDPDQKYMGLSAELAAQILRLIGNWMSLWLWGLAFWFFFVSVISNIAPLWTHTRAQCPGEEECTDPDHHHKHIELRKIPFAMTWYSYIFPQTALTTSTFRIAEAFNIYAIEILGCVMAALLVAMWFFVVTMMVRAVLLKQILWPEKGEDKEEGGFKREVGNLETTVARPRRPAQPEPVSEAGNESQV